LFYSINTTSHAAWGTLPALMQSLFELNLEVIDHRSWHSRFASTVINEVYVKGLLKKGEDASSQIGLIQQKVKVSISQSVSSHIYFSANFCLFEDFINLTRLFLFYLYLERMPLSK
jgi:hypothetical protein